MIQIQWKGVLATATKTADGWTGPPDLDLSRFEDEQAAADRLGGIVIETPDIQPVTD